MQEKTQKVELDLEYAFSPNGLAHYHESRSAYLC
jgi:hypothetical protein